MADGMEVQSDVALSDDCGSLSDEGSNGGLAVVSGNQKFQEQFLLFWMTELQSRNPSGEYRHLVN